MAIVGDYLVSVDQVLERIDRPGLIPARVLEDQLEDINSIPCSVKDNKTASLSGYLMPLRRPGCRFRRR